MTFNKTFGELEYNIGWVKKETVSFWNKEYSIIVRFSCDKDRYPNDKQEQSYLMLVKNLIQFSQESYTKVQEYINDNKEYISYIIGDKHLDLNLKEFIIPTELLFFSTGDFAMICQIARTEEELIILYHNGEIKIGGTFLLESLNLY